MELQGVLVEDVGTVDDEARALDLRRAIEEVRRRQEAARPRRDPRDQRDPRRRLSIALDYRMDRNGPRVVAGHWRDNKSHEWFEVTPTFEFFARLLGLIAP